MGFAQMGLRLSIFHDTVAALSESGNNRNIMSEVEEGVYNLTGGRLAGEIIVAVLLLIATAILTHLVVRWIRHIMRKEDNSLAESSLIINIVRAIMWGIGICFILAACFNVDVTALVAALGVSGIAFSLGLQDTLKNLIGGMQVSFMHILSPGDNIQVGSNSGVVQDVTWRHTIIKNSLGEITVIPNSVISTTAVTHLAPPERVTVHFVVSNHDDMAEVAKGIAEAAQAAAAECACVVEDAVVSFSEIMEDGTIGKVVVEIDDAAQAVAAKDAITRAIAPLVR